MDNNKVTTIDEVIDTIEAHRHLYRLREAWIVAKYKEGMSVTDIATRCRMKHQNVSSIIKRIKDGQ